MSLLKQTTPWSESELSNCYPLHKACKDGDPQVATALLQTNRNLALEEDRFCGWTPIHWAAYFGKLDCLRIVVSALVNGMNLQTTRHSQSPSHCAAEAGHSHCLLWLLQAGANPNLKDFSGETALHKCCRTGNAECVSLLLETTCDVRALNNAGELASAIAEKHGFPAISSYIHQAELVRELGGKPPFSQISNLSCSFPNGMRNISFPDANGIRLNRKRSFNDMNNNNNVTKRIRIDDPMIDMPTQNMVLDNEENTSTCITSSVVEHERLCNVEQGYSNTFLLCMYSEFHGR